ncbi:hypothetical protein J0X14_17620 [Muricauda sp. CAU 1633]|uniref:hypothetical protein n=1 Tax=Allomuricauda sp. CAU 1633 TaxID=2816036 RepID=UPI001A8D83A6|nr:hypothetical protein [Muricauda sp. CAU 1633]MBO0324133.1 hypothetical protein [Muricauda sp. CAU 1633]
MERKITFFAESLEEMDYCGSKLLQAKGGIFEFPFKVEPTLTKHNLLNCQDCKNHYDKLIQGFNDTLKRFPNCCSSHSKLINLGEFAVGNYSDSAIWSADKIMFSYHHFLEFIDNDEWYKEITDYFEYCIESYGSFPRGYGEPFLLSNYFSCLLHLINHIKTELTSDVINQKELILRTERIINYLNSYSDADLNKNKTKNFNLLMSKYDEWFSLFPFDMEYFKHLKRTFEKQIPVFRGTHQNKYLGSTKLELHSLDDFAEVLISITKSILSEVNGLKLYKEGKLNDAEKISLDLIIQNRELELKELSLKSNISKVQYLKTLKDWLKSEKKFIRDITPYLSKENKNNNSSKTGRPNRTDIAYFCYYTSETKELIIGHRFPSDKAWGEIGQRFNRNATNIKLMYNIIRKNQQERLTESKKGNIEYVLENMLGDYPKAKSMAEKELNMT